MGASRELRGYFTESEYQEIMHWLGQQKKFAKASHFIRYAVYSTMKKTRPGAHHETTGRRVGRPQKNQGASVRPDFTGEYKEPYTL